MLLLLCRELQQQVTSSRLGWGLHGLREPRELKPEVKEGVEGVGRGMFLVRAAVGGAGVRAEDGGGKGMQRGEQWPDHGDLCKGQSKKLEFYSQCDGKALKSFQQEYYTICYIHLKR